MTQIRKFRGAQLFVINVLLKLFERSPLGSVLLRRSVVFNPTLTLTVTKEEMQRCLKGLLAHLIDLNIIIPITCDTVADLFSTYLENEVKTHKQKFENFDPKNTRLDTFYFKDLDIGKYKELSFVIRLIFTLSHGQSAVERSFSLRGNLEQDNQEEDTIISIRIIKDYLTSNKIEPYNVVIDKPLMQAVKNSRLKYQQYLGEKRKLKDETMAEQKAKEAANRTS